MEIGKRAPVLAAAIALTGCVYTTQPIGERPVSLDADDWNGAWIACGEDDGGQAPFFTRVIDREGGALEVAHVDLHKAGFSLEATQVLVMESGAVKFANMLDSDNPEAPRYLWAKFERDEDQLRLFEPDDDAFEEWVKSGVLPGSLGKHGCVQLDELSPEHMALIASAPSDSLFKSPKAYRRSDF